MEKKQIKVMAPEGFHFTGEVTNSEEGNTIVVTFEEDGPKVVPFEDMTEFCKAWNYGPIKLKGNAKDTYGIQEISNHGVLCSPSYYTWEYLAENFTFSDGTPCGKEVEE